MPRFAQRAARLAAAILAAGTVLGVVAAGPVADASPRPAQLLPHPATSPYAPKGRPPPVGADATRGAAVTPKVIPDPSSGTYLYSGAIQGDPQYPVLADGARAYYTIAKPVVAAGGHSLAELAVSSPDSQQVVEIGWSVDRGVNGDDDPHLFVFHWINGQPTCYNGCGFVPLDVPGVAAGMKLPVTSTPVQFAIYHHGAAWFVGYNGHLFGSFPDSEWNNTFKLTGIVQWFGEVNTSTDNPTPCTQMGNGEPASSPTAARIERMGFWPSRVTPAFSASQTNGDLYTVLPSSAGIRFGGPGACRTVPNVVGDSPTVARNAIKALGLVPGTIGTVTDWLCEDLNKVLSQNPAPGTQLSAGLPVGFIYGVPPATGCPNPRL